MGKIIHALNGNSNENLITGLLLIYPRFYMHLLEAPEDIIYMHFKDIYENKNKDGKFGKAIVLLVYHHVYHAHEIAGSLFHLNEEIPEYLPEMTVLEYFLNLKSNILTTVEDYMRIYRDVPFIEFYGDTIWPPPSYNLPRYDALEKCVDRLTDEDDLTRKKI
ncbi:PREDICTED: uncharacterized protein LOC107068782 [Polistes dominula]|uniref:Uncharacterized protein LOC107068782 n=1 Tax=Polistes dominula TaxID=743375 RepID=A0ABM1ILB6_POLDO|nr:PREDICTED: uncharacterized protein LOC107068782 [Polistes dominula]